MERPVTNWLDVASSAIRRVGYDRETRRMVIDFHDSLPHYTYCNVPESVFIDLVNASSVGRYYQSFIKDNYPC